MYDIQAKVTEALSNAMIMSGLPKRDITNVMNGATIYGDDGVLDSVGLVRLIGGVSVGFEDLGIDMFDMLEEMAANPAEVFSTKASILEFTSRVLQDALLEPAE